MTDSINPLPARPSLLDIVERASLFAILQQALEHDRKPRLQPLPPSLYGDLGMPPTQPIGTDSKYR